MNRNFFAIDALAYGLQSGITQIPLFLRRGWLGVAVFLVSSFGLSGATINLTNGFMDPEFSDAVYEFVDGFAAAFQEGGDPRDQNPFANMPDEERVFFGSYMLALFGQFLGIILMVPGFVDLYKTAAGRQPGEGNLPSFGKAEWAVVVAVLLVLAVSIGFAIAVLIPVGGLIALGAVTENPIFFVLAGALAVVLAIWFQVKLLLIPAHAALREEVAFGDGFTLAKGSFWKLLGTYLLVGFVLALISALFDILGVATDAFLGYGASIAIVSVYTVYAYVAQTATYGRIASDLMGLQSDGELVQADGADEDLEDFIQDDEPDTADEGDGLDVLNEAASVDVAERDPNQSFGQPMRRREPGFVPRRLR